MNENINLCEILKGCEGIELYSIIHGSIKVIEICDNYIVFYPLSDISLKIHIGSSGIWAEKFPGECIILPSKEQRDWSKFVMKYAPVVYSDSSREISESKHIEWSIGYYHSYCTSEKTHLILPRLEGAGVINVKYIIPYNKFDPLNIKESLKYNIQDNDKK